MYNRIKPKRLSIRNPNAAWVTSELAKLYSEWKAWHDYVLTIEDHDYDRNTHAECYADGVENIRKHEILRAKTLAFLDNNIEGHDFMLSNQYELPYEDNMGRLRTKLPHRIHELDILIASLQYAAVPEGFWKEQGKKMVEQLATVAPEKAADAAASWLRNPFAAK